MTNNAKKGRVRRGVFLLPSLFTTGNLFLGFYAVVLALQLDFESAALLIFAAGILDGFDGRLARLTASESDFGREYDSLADLATFGVAPAMLAYLWGLNEVGRIGWLVPFFFLVCAATRLARYNVQHKPGSKRYFVGLPTPAAAAGVASVLFIAPDNDYKEWLNVLLLIVVPALGLLMVSTFRYTNLNGLDLKRRFPYRIVLVSAAILLAIAFHPPAFFVSVATIYTCSGPVVWMRSLVRRRWLPARSEAPRERRE